MVSMVLLMSLPHEAIDTLLCHNICMGCYTGLLYVKFRIRLQWASQWNLCCVPYDVWSAYKLKYLVSEYWNTWNWCFCILQYIPTDKIALPFLEKYHSCFVECWLPLRFDYCNIIIYDNCSLLFGRALVLFKLHCFVTKIGRASCRERV